MKNNFYSKNFISIILPIYFILMSIYPIFRAMLIGSDLSSSLYEIIIAVVPEILSFIILFYLLYNEILILRKKTFKLLLFDYIIFAYIVINIIIGTILSDSLLISLYAIKMTYLPVVLYFIGRFYGFLDEKKVNYFLNFIMYWLLGIAIIGLVLYFIFPNVEDWLLKTTNSQRNQYVIFRMSSIMLTPILFAPFMSFGALYTYYKIQTHFKIHYFIYFLIFFTCLLVSVTRGPIVTFIIGFFVLTIIFKKWKYFILNFLSMSLIILFLIFIVIPFLTNKNSGNNTGNLASDVPKWVVSSTVETVSLEKSTKRVNIFYQTIEDIKKNYMGYGFGKAGALSHQFYSAETPNIAYSSTDCWYLKITCETGVIGLITYLTLVFSLFFSSIKHWSKYKQNYFLFLFLFVFLFNIENFVHNLPDLYLISSFYWLILGLVQNIIKNQNQLNDGYINSNC